MGDRVARTFRTLGLEGEGVRAVLLNHERAMEQRRARLEDDHHPAFLHPGRSLIVALDDAGVRDPKLLALLPLMDSVNPELAPDPLEWAEALDRLGTPPLAPGASLEALVQLDPESMSVVLSEALDHLRHLHLLDGVERRRRLAERAESLVLPLAGRLGGALDRRLRWWWRRVGRGLLKH